MSIPRCVICAVCVTPCTYYILTQLPLIFFVFLASEAPKKIKDLMAAPDAGKDADSAADSKNAVKHMCLRVTLPVGTTVDSLVHTSYRERFESFLTKVCDRWIYQTEDPSGSYQNVHFQGYGHLRGRVRPAQLHADLLVSVHAGDPAKFKLCHVSPSSKSGISSLKNYSMKKETRIAGPFADSKNSVAEAAPLKCLEEKDLFKWQKELDVVLDAEPDDRKIYWITDTIGGHGKSWWAKYRFVKHKDCVIRYAKVSEMTHIVAGNKNKRVYIFDLSRSKPADFKMEDLYSLAEALKDGMITSGRYHSETWAQNTAHVIILSNFFPQKSALSTDRLVPWELVDGMLII